ncbi:alkaline shock response membrane anchor protein AmaP [Adlercreutzia sp. ZJ304]|uniref:alkaline shock response membrane anchor protein AmaP n=1 Tax=Adlercreutzia sp. ZJ304 TaxID=2709791 RepID=UPI0013E9C6F9|nr:alkaline shock response membrane anchor protein AmaP [Adlercreutzia sp. ZJ304]
MRKFTRFCLVIFIIAAILGIGVLAVLWFSWEPLLPLASWLAGMSWFNIALLVVLGIVAIGLIALLICALATPGKGSKLLLRREDGTVSITKEAIRSTAKYVLESHSGIETKDLKVSIHGKHNPRISISANIEPKANLNLASLGETLQQEIISSVSTLTGYPVEKVDITFAGNPTNTLYTENTSINVRREGSHVGYKRPSQSVIGA